MAETWVRIEDIGDDTVLRSRVELDDRESYTIERTLLVRLLLDAGYRVAEEAELLDWPPEEDVPHISTP